MTPLMNLPSVPAYVPGSQTMSLESQTEFSLRALRNTHRGVLILLGSMAALILLNDFGGQPPPPDPYGTSAAIALALVSIVLRRFASSSAVRPSTAISLALGALFAAAGLGLLGAYEALQSESSETGLLFVLAGFIFALRAPRPGAPEEGV